MDELQEKDSSHNLRLGDEQRKTHTLIRGTTGSGKTALMLSIIYQDLLRAFPSLVVVDPVGELFTRSMQFLSSIDRQLTMKSRTKYPAYNAMVRQQQDTFFKRINVLDFERSDSGFFLNPLEKINGMSASETAGDFLRIFERISQGDMSVQLRRQLILGACCSLISELNGTLRDVHLLLNKDSDEICGYVEVLGNKADAEGRPFHLEFARDYLQQFLAATKGRERRELVQSSINAIALFLRDECVCSFISAPVGNLDFSAIVNDGRYLFVNIPPTMDFNSQVVLGSMIVNKIQTTVMRRTPALRKRPVTLMVDEFHMMMGKEFAQAVSKIRNYGLSLVLAHQNESQLLSDQDGRKLLEEITHNTTTHILFRQGYDDATRASASVFRPLGKREKNRFEEETQSQQRSRQVSVTESISKAIGEAHSKSTGKSFSISNGMQISFSENNGVSRSHVEARGLTISSGKNWSKCTSKSHGVSVTQSDSETIVQGIGKARANSRAEGESSSEGSSQSTGSSRNEGEGSFYSFSDGNSMSSNSLDAGFVGMNTASQQNNGHGVSRNESKNYSDSDSTQYSNSRSLTRAISDVISSSRSLARATGKSVGTTHATTKSKTVGGFNSESHSETLAKGIAFIESYCKSMGESITTAESRSEGETKTESRTDTFGRSQAKSTGTTIGSSKTEKRAFYSVDEEATVLGYQLEYLPKREAYVLNRIDGEVTRIRTLDIPYEFDLERKILGIDFMKDLRERVKPKAVQIPRKSVFERLQERELDSIKQDDVETGF